MKLIDMLDKLYDAINFVNMNPGAVFDMDEIYDTFDDLECGIEALRIIIKKNTDIKSLKSSLNHVEYNMSHEIELSEKEYKSIVRVIREGLV